MNKNEIKIMICTPIYNDVKVEYHISMLETAIAFEKSNIYLDIQHVIGSSIIEDARNELVQIFLNSPDNPTHLLFIDSDIKWELQDIRDLIEFSDNNDHLIVSGIYSKKKLNQDNLSLDNLGQLENLFSPVTNNYNLTKKEPIQVNYVGMGFCLINKFVFEKFKKHYKNLEYIERNKLSYLYFSNGFIEENGTKLRYGEDSYFCKLCSNIGINTWVLPWVNVRHIGNVEYTCKLI